MSTVRVRFAPSPTGYLHVGGLRTALYNFLFARQQNGAFVLRIEDTDQSRKVEGAAENLMAMLRWAGIEYDEGPDKEGLAGPYVQSSRLDIYREHVAQLLDKGKAYHCFCTPERLKEVRDRQAAAKGSLNYDRQCRGLSAEASAARVRSGEAHVVRMKVPVEGETTFSDAIRGEITIAHEIVDDQVILKSDGFPTYHLAVVVDDHLMGITHVVRGEEWLPSTPKHVLLYKAFGWDLPVFAHLPLLLNSDRSKLSKRQGDVSVEAYRDQGYLPDALVNFVALLGWNPGDDREVFTMKELISEFSLERVGKAGAIFNLEKLAWLNAQHLRSRTDQEICDMLRHAAASGPVDLSSFSDAYLLKIIPSMRERMTFPKDVLEKSPYFFRPPEHYDPEIVTKRWKQETPARMERLRDAFAALSTPAKEDFERTLEQNADAQGIKKADLIHPLRLAISGMGTGPGVYDIVDILGKEETLRRITRAIEVLTHR